MMVGRRLLSLLKYRAATIAPPVPSATEEGKGKSLGRKLVSGALICLIGCVALSTIDDLVIFQGRSIKAIEKSSQNQSVIEAIEEPIVRGPSYNASLAVAHRRQSVSCTFPVFGQQGSGMFQLKRMLMFGASLKN